MVAPLFIAVLLVGFFVTFFTMPLWINKARRIGLVWPDMNKYNNPKNVAGSGGLIVILGFIVALLLFIAIETFYYKSDTDIIRIFTIISAILMLAFIGMVDSLMGWGGGLNRSGLRKRYRILLCFLAAIPLVVINAGDHLISVPFLGLINLGWFYTLIIIPLAIVGASTTFNFLAGWNGLESGQGMIILFSMSIVAYWTGNGWLAMVGASMVLALFAFWIYNKYPAKVFPGDVLTYPIGGVIAIMAILGNFEKIALFFFIPYILEVILKARGKLEKQSFGKPNRDGSIDLLYNRVYGLEHLSILVLKKLEFKATEKRVVYLIHGFQIFIILLGFLIFRNSIF